MLNIAIFMSVIGTVFAIGLTIFGVWFHKESKKHQKKSIND